MLIDPVMKEIYRAYFARDKWRVVGITEEVSLASALQMKNEYSELGVYSPHQFNVIKQYDKVALWAALAFVKKYSTFPNI